MPLVVNSLGGRLTHTNFLDRNNFKKPGMYWPNPESYIANIYGYM